MRDAGGPMGGAGVGGRPPTLFPDAMIPFPIEGEICVLSVGARCDGAEDCGDGQRCCAQFVSDGFTYVSIGCQLTCEPPSGYVLCHQDNDCDQRGFECRPSLIASFPSTSVCAPPNGVWAEPTEPIPGEVACGSESCDAETQQCCLRASFDLKKGPYPQFLEPFCAPVAAGDEACSCDAVPPEPDPPDAGPQVPDASPDAEIPDAAIPDASQPEPIDDDAG
jgi:hypothetical protein